MPDPLDAQATRSMIESLSRAGLLDDAARVEALESLTARAAWWRPLSFLLSSLGTTLVLSGIVYFFAANWSGLSRLEKLGLAVLLLIAALGLALGRGIDSLAGRLALVSATVLTGAFLAVFGQVYQTGADAWQLFAAWAVLSLPWMLVSRFLGHIVVWLVVLQLGIGTWWLQELHPEQLVFPFGLCLLVALIALAAMLLFDWLSGRGEDWAAQGWSQRLLLSFALFSLALPTCVLILEPEEASSVSVSVAVVALATIGASWWWHRTRRFDLAALALTALAAVAVLLTGIGKPLFEFSEEWPMFILFGLIVSAAIGGATVLLQHEQIAARKRP